MCALLRRGATSGHDADDRIIYNTSTGQLFTTPMATVQDGAADRHVPGAPTVVAGDINVFGTPTPTPTPTPSGRSSTAPTATTRWSAEAARHDLRLRRHDTIDGGAGADSMIGGPGDDVYFVDNGSTRSSSSKTRASTRSEPRSATPSRLVIT